MPFPISLSGTVTVRGLTVEQALDRLERALAKVKAAALRREGRSLIFRGGMFRFVSSWNVLRPIRRGRLDLSPQGDGVRVSWNGRFGELLAGVTVVVVVAMALMAPRLSPVDEPLVWLGMWLWLFGANFVLALWRFPRFLIRALQSNGRGATSP